MAPEGASGNAGAARSVRPFLPQANAMLEMTEASSFEESGKLPEESRHDCHSLKDPVPGLFSPELPPSPAIPAFPG